MPEDSAIQIQLAKELFNRTWDLLDRTDRSPEDDLRMIGSALASWELWRRSGDHRNHAISDWQVSRVLAVLGEGELAGRFADQGLDLCRAHDLGPFLLAYAWESAARVAHLNGDAERTSSAIMASRAAADLVEDGDDRQLILDDLAELSP